MPATWTESADRQLLLIIIEMMLGAGSGHLPKWDVVAKHMGEDYTAGAVSQRFTKKLRKETQAKFSGVKESPTPATPKKKKEKANGTPASKKRKTTASSDAEGDIDEEAGPVIKMEMEDDPFT